MKTRTRICLMFLITLLFTLALTVPGLASRRVPIEPPDDCVYLYPASSSGGNTVVYMPISGELSPVGIYTHINYCVGEVHFGWPVPDKEAFTYYSYNDLAGLDIFFWTEQSATASIDCNGDWVWWLDYDMMGYDRAKATSCGVTIYPNGNFVVTKVY